MLALYLLITNIFKKVYQEDYKRPWLFIGISAIILSISQLTRFLYENFHIIIVNDFFTQFFIYILDFISITILAYALLLEYVILKFYKGKFVKVKFIPVQEGTLGGEIDINVSNGVSYLAIKKDRRFLIEQFSQATKKGYQGFLLTEDNPKDVRLRYGIQKTPIAWIREIENDNENYIRSSLDSNSDVASPLQLNNMINYIDNFLEQSQTPFIVIDLNLIIKVNTFVVVEEFLKYVSSKTKRYNGILICMINTDYASKQDIASLQNFLTDLE